MGQVNGKGCVGTVVDLHVSWRFFVDADSAMCVALLVPEMNARICAKSH